MTTTNTTRRKRRTQGKPEVTAPVVDSRAMLDGTVDEKDLQLAAIQFAHLHGWLCYHVFDSRMASTKHVDKGFPDWILAKEGRVLALEFKTERGKLTLAQCEWIYQLSAEGRIECFIFRPHDWSSGHIEAVLLGQSAIGAA